MQKIPMVSLQRHNHDGTWYLTGQQFSANTETEANEMECLHIAKRAKRKTDAEDAAEAEKATTVTREVKATDEAPAAAAAKKNALSLPPKGEYSRRDVRAAR